MSYSSARRAALMADGETAALPAPIDLMLLGCPDLYGAHRLQGIAHFFF